MADEATIRASLQIRKTSGSITMINENVSEGFSDTVAGTKGPCPGALTVPPGGKVVPLDELSTPGWCIIKNVSPTESVEWGIRDPDSNRFYPVGEIGPGQTAGPFKFSRNVLEEYTGTGTGTSSPGNQFFMTAMGSVDAVVQIKAYEA